VPSKKARQIAAYAPETIGVEKRGQATARSASAGRKLALAAIVVVGLASSEPPSIELDFSEIVLLA
jgi:hypothetical protein